MDDDPSSEQVRRWRSKAEECRAAADLLEDAIAMTYFRRMAQTYDSMANGLEEMAAVQKAGDELSAMADDEAPIIERARR